VRRHSLVGPVILILIGVAFLLNNIRPDWNLFSFVADYWPFLLIAIGTLRLLEVLAFAATSRPIVSRGLSGGEVFLVILVTVIGVGMHQARTRFGPFGPSRRIVELFGESYDYPVSKQLAINSKSRILFDNVRGNVRVTPSDAPEIRISGHKTIRALNRGDADRANDQTPVEIIADGDRIIVRTNQERVSGERRVTTELEVTLPREVSIEGRGRVGDFDITGITGSVQITSDNSGVRLSKLGGNAKVDVKQSDVVRAVDVNGSVEVTGHGNDLELENVQGTVTVNGSFGGNLEFKNIAKAFHFESRNTEMRAERIPGRINMDLASLSGVNLVGPISLTTKSKDVKLEDFTQSLQLEIERGDIELRPHSLPLSKMDVRCRNVGNINLALPAQAKFELVASTSSGEARNDYGPPVMRVDGEGRSASLKTSIEGGPMIQISTARGTVTVRKESDLLEKPDR